MSQITEHTDTFEITDGNKSHTILEYTVFNLSNAGGIQRKSIADRKYQTTDGRSVGHKNHKEFQPFGSNAWLERK